MRELRRPHRARWRATKEGMARALGATKSPQSIFDFMPAVATNCRECRKWLPPARQAISALRLLTR
eukprot:8622496-Pyramimonas_sp.AAC.1